VYGRSKLAGEQATLTDPRNLVVRTSWVCSAHGSNMVKTILRLAESYDTLTFVDDQVGKPTFTSDLGAALLTLAGRDDTGIMHVTNEGVVSWYEFCREVLSAAGLDPARVKPCATHELQPPRPAPRPPNSVLANTRFSGLGLPLLRDFREPLAELVQELI
jgi:dTDP-4-dehydrorhamnose reductase